MKKIELLEKIEQLEIRVKWLERMAQKTFITKRPKNPKEFKTSPYSRTVEQGFKKNISYWRMLGLVKNGAYRKNSFINA